MSYLASISKTAEELDAEEPAFVKEIKENLSLFEEHVEEIDARLNIKPENPLEYAALFLTVSESAKFNLIQGIPTQRQEEESNLKWILAHEQGKISAHHELYRLQERILEKTVRSWT